MTAWLERLFPGLQGTLYALTSPPTESSNCLAWAVGDTTTWWWPVWYQGRRTYWPPGVEATETVGAFVAALASVGFVPCATEDLEPGHEKVALFATADGTPTHAARQLPSGAWTSKLGRGDDIEHPLRALEGANYGIVVVLLHRPRAGG